MRGEMSRKKGEMCLRIGDRQKTPADHGAEAARPAGETSAGRPRPADQCGPEISEGPNARRRLGACGAARRGLMRPSPQKGSAIPELPGRRARRAKKKEDGGVGRAPCRIWKRYAEGGTNGVEAIRQAGCRGVAAARYLLRGRAGGP